eukprot:11815794-Karenia_brevis.AAC.1
MAEVSSLLTATGGCFLAAACFASASARRLALQSTCESRMPSERLTSPMEAGVVCAGIHTRVLWSAST